MTKLDKLLKAISHPTRRKLFDLLIAATTALSITQLSTQFEISRQGLTKHLLLLKDAGLVNIRTLGREAFCSAEISGLAEIRNWIEYYERFWEKQLISLGKHLDKKKK